MSNKIQMSHEVLEDILKLSGHGIRITGIEYDHSIGIVTFTTEGSDIDSEYLKLCYTRPYDVDGPITQLRQDVVLTVSAMDPPVFNYDMEFLQRAIDSGSITIPTYKSYMFQNFLHNGVPPDTQIRFLDVLADTHRVGDVKEIPPPSDPWFTPAGLRRGELSVAYSGRVVFVDVGE